MERYTVKLTPAAQIQLKEIGYYVSVHLQAPENAIRLLNTLKKEIQSLSVFPQRIALTEDEPWRSKGIHKMPVKNYLVYFWIDESLHIVQVYAIIYGRRDQKKQLSIWID